LRPVELDVDDVDAVFVLRIGVDPRVVPGALAEIAALVGLLPGVAAVARAEDAALIGLDDGVDVVRIARRDGDAADAERPLRHPLVARDFLPAVAAVGRLPDAGAVAAALESPRQAA